MAQYTEKAQEALVLASEAAEDMGSPVIGTEHILVGLIEEGSGTAAMVLEANEVKLDRLLALVEQLGLVDYFRLLYLQQLLQLRLQQLILFFLLLLVLLT